tara:strand:- start:193 stop:420 length:228 start_codon:yes stop_codon:yes gene_type:complete
MTRGISGSGVGGFTIKDNKKEYHASYYQKNKERILARTKERYEANPEKYRALSQKNYKAQQFKKVFGLPVIYERE